MRLALKLSLLLALAVTLPLVVVLAVLLPRGSAALESQLRALYAQDARSLALECQRTVLDDLDALSMAARTLRLPDLDPDTRRQALLLLYKETRGADVIGLFDEKGNPVVPPVRFAQLEPESAREHETVSDLGMVAYAHHVPLEAALVTGLAIGPVYAIPDDTGFILPRVVLAARIPEKKWVLAMELSLRPVLRSIAGFQAGATGQAFLVDARNRVIAHRDTLRVRDRTDLSTHPLLAATRHGDVLGATAVAPILGWKVVVEQPASEGLAPVRGAMRTAALLVLLALAGAVATGLVAVRVVTRPVQTLHAAAKSVTAGSLEVQVPEEGKDELAELSQTFNAMTAGLRERDQIKRVLTLSQTLDLQEVLHRLLDSLARVVPFDRAAVMIARLDGFEVAMARGYFENDPAVHRPHTDADARKAVAERKALVSQDRRTLHVPLLSREQETAGLVCLERQTGYDEGAARVAFEFIQPAAVAVDNARLFSEVKRLATTDGLTGISNRRHFLLLAQRLFETARRYGQPLSALMLDVDSFKAVNDKHGHGVGDEVLRAIAARTQQCLRSADLLGRYGGEEFAVLLPMTQALAAHNLLAERIRRTVAQAPVTTSAGPLQVTVSIGVSSLTPQVETLEALLNEADSRLYQAKTAGRNRVA